MIAIPTSIVKRVPYVGPVVSGVGLALDVKDIVETATPVGAAKIIAGRLVNRIEQMAKAISQNETMTGPVSAFKEFTESRKGIILHLRGPKGANRSIGLAQKPPHPKSEDLFNSTNSIRGGSISLEVDEIKNQKSFFDLILENKNKISFILICGAILYVCFKKFSFNLLLLFLDNSNKL